MKSRSAKNKGVRLQNLVRESLIGTLGLDPAKVVCAIMGESGEDIKDYSGKLPLSIECKNVERLNLWGAISQAKENAGGKIPTVVFKRNRSDVWAALPWDDLLKLMAKAQEVDRVGE